MMPQIIHNIPELELELELEPESEPAAALSDTRSRSLLNHADMMGDTTDDRREASVVLCLTLGLAAGTPHARLAWLCRPL